MAPAARPASSGHRGRARPRLARRLHRLLGLGARPGRGRARRGAPRVAAAGELIRSGKYREAQDALRPVLAENPQQREARRLQRAIDDKLTAPVMVSAQLKPPQATPISLELRDVSVRNVFEVLQRASGVSFVFDRDVRADQRTSITLRNASIEEAIRLALLTNQLEQKIVNETTV